MARVISDSIYSLAADPGVNSNGELLTQSVLNLKVIAIRKLSLGLASLQSIFAHALQQISFLQICCINLPVIKVLI